MRVGQYRNIDAYMCVYMQDIVQAQLLRQTERSVTLRDWDVQKKTMRKSLYSFRSAKRQDDKEQDFPQVRRVYVKRLQDTSFAGTRVSGN